MAHLVRYNRFPSLVNDLLNDDFWGGRLENAPYSPAVNIYENESTYTLEFSVPGLSRDVLKVAVENNVLTISNKPGDKSNENTKYLRREFTTGSFERSFELPKNIEGNKIEANHENGVLTISIPKKAKVEIPVQDVEIK